MKAIILEIDSLGGVKQIDLVWENEAEQAVVEYAMRRLIDSEQIERTMISIDSRISFAKKRKQIIAGKGQKLIQLSIVYDPENPPDFNHQPKSSYVHQIKRDHPDT